MDVDNDNKRRREEENEDDDVHKKKVGLSKDNNFVQHNMSTTDTPLEDIPYCQLCSREQVGPSQSDNSVNDNDKERDDNKDTEMDTETNDNNETTDEFPIMSNQEMRLTIFLNQLNARENYFPKCLNQMVCEKNTSESQKEKYSELEKKLFWVKNRIITTNEKLEKIKQYQEDDVEDVPLWNLLPGILQMMSQFKESNKDTHINGIEQ